MLIYRGTILNPKSAKKCDFFSDGGLVVDNKKILALGNFSKIKKQFSHGKIIQFNGIICPNFCDLHLHWVQNRVKGIFQKELLPWLRNHIWPEESKFADEKYAKNMAEIFFKELAKNGTTLAVIYSSIHQPATEIAFKLGKNFGHFIIGNVLMTQNSPDYLLQNGNDALKITEKLAEKYKHNYAVTPRFAPTCGLQFMQAAAKIARKYNSFIQTHLSENKDEIKWVKTLFPNCKTYTDVYKKADILSPKTILGHCIHLSSAEWQMLQKSNSAVAHCPTSNIALKSGRMPLEKVRQYKIKYALGSDIGAGPSLNMLSVIKAYLKVHQGKGRITPIEALYRATLAGAEILGLKNITGNLDQGKEANFVVLKKIKSVKLNSSDAALSSLFNASEKTLNKLVLQTYFRGNRIY